MKKVLMSAILFLGLHVYAEKSNSESFYNRKIAQLESFYNRKVAQLSNAKDAFMYSPSTRAILEHYGPPLAFIILTTTMQIMFPKIAASGSENIGANSGLGITDNLAKDAIFLPDPVSAQPAPATSSDGK